MRIKSRSLPAIGLLAFFLLMSSALPEELPKPTYANSLVVSIEHNPADAAEIDIIKSRLNFGLYAWLSLSITAISPALDWHASWQDADRGIQAFKDQVNSFFEVARTKGTSVHVVLTSGLARSWFLYRAAKEEDVRNCQWYNDNKICADDQIAASDYMDTRVYGTLSRYARKVRANLEAKSRAAAVFLKQKMDEAPDVIAAVSGWGEAELNQYRINHTKSIQDWFCDYSPFAVLEFRDWVQHAGMYDDATGEFRGQGYSLGGSKFQGKIGLATLNSEFGTSFRTWDLKYFNWSLADDWDQTPTDTVNNDPRRIPLSGYAHGGMMPSSGENYIAGGFDPPRVMGWPKGTPGHSDFWDLWNLFRETMVHHFVKDLARWAHEAGIPADRWYTHQIPGDYLYGSTPETPLKNARYYTSASPLWTTNTQPYGSPGASIYDIKFPGYFVRTTTFAVPAVEKIAPNWAIMEYDPETYPIGFNVPQSNAGPIFDQHVFVYTHRPHLINFFRWIDGSGEHQIKDMNKEAALKGFINLVRDKARSTDIAMMFDPPKITEIAVSGDPGGGGVDFRLSGKIWGGLKWEWKDWGDFLKFEVYRGTEAGFPLDAAHLLFTSAETAFRDATAAAGQTYFYKVRAVNKKGIAGPASSAIRMPGRTLAISATEGGTTDPAPGVHSYEADREVAVWARPFSEYMFIGWGGDASGMANPLVVTLDVPKMVSARFAKGYVFPPVNFSGKKIANRSLAQVETIIELTWEANPNNTDVRGYRLYGYEGGGMTFVTEMDAGTFVYERRRAAGDQSYMFGLTTVDRSGKESPQMTVIVQ